MRFYSPEARMEKWFLTLFFREVGSPQPVRVGSSVLTFGRGKEFTGEFSYVQIEVTKEEASVEVFPGARILGIVCSPEPGINQDYVKSLSSRDEVELISPMDQVIVTDMAMAKDLIAQGSTESIKKHLEVDQGKRKTFYG